MNERRAVVERFCQSLSKEQKDDLYCILLVGLNADLVEILENFELSDNGYDNGYDDGYSDAKEEIDSRVEEARDDGYRDGDRDGYVKGYKDGKEGIK